MVFDNEIKVQHKLNVALENSPFEYSIELPNMHQIMIDYIKGYFNLSEEQLYNMFDLAFMETNDNRLDNSEVYANLYDNFFDENINKINEVVSLELFVDIMNRIDEYHKFDNKLYNIISKRYKDFDLIDYSLESEIVNALEEDFNDEDNQWISYFMYELDMLKNFKLGDIVFEGVNIDVSTWYKAYDFLLDRMNE